MAHQAKPQSFKNRDFFPSFRDCPADEWDERFFQEDEPGIHCKQWCLLGEIIEADTFLRPRIVAKDYKGDEFVVAFYPDDEGDMPRILKDFKVGNTIAVFYAVIHGFLDQTWGVRVENTNSVLIMPLKMDEVMAMNKEVIEYTPAEGAPRRCHTCGEAKEGLDRCGGCTLFSYCNKECQAKAWNEKGHKRFCKALKNKNVRDMHFLDYDDCSDCIAFS
ncbi:hypothetical protein DL765_000723 [Monosporascus sp. GIB2]|nr:hypothetical protein DL765_000723 [Monosporascus sp. GIB2]